MDPHRLRYLEAMGITVYLRRTRPGPQAGSSRGPVEDRRRSTAVAQVPSPDASPGAPSVPAIPSAGDPAAGLDWAALEAAVRACTRCPLHAGRTNAVCGVGNRHADLMVIGEAPGRDEDLKGEPFVGRAGKLLDNMLRAIHLDRGQVYIGNILKCRPPNNRDPQPAEADACRSYLDRQIALIRPRLILSVGRVCAHNLLHTDVPVGRLRGRVHSVEPGGIPVIVTYHPAYLLRSPGEKRKAWDDLRLARSVLEDEGG
jgi:DNA polymerase